MIEPYTQFELKEAKLALKFIDFIDYQKEHDILEDIIETQLARPSRKQKTLVGNYVCDKCEVAFIGDTVDTPFCGNCGQYLGVENE